jgi:CHASE3 domain sensor protein
MGENMSRIFDHTKQYACTEVFRLEEIQATMEEMEEFIEPDSERFRTAPQRLFALSNSAKDAMEKINEFIKNLKEQDRQK